MTNCLNFGRPENEENMGEFVECVQGIGEAAEYLKFPVVSGNVSFYNQTKEQGIKPTPSIGGVGLIKYYNKMITMDFKDIAHLVLVIGKTEGHIDQSLFARNILDDKNGPPPEVNLFNEKKAPKLILTRGKLPWSVGIPEGEYLKDISIKNGISKSNILLTENAQNTEQEAKAIKKLLNENDRIILVTSAFHMPRAKKVFEAANIRIIPFAVDFNRSTKKTTLMDFIPNAQSLSVTSFFVREMIGRLYYSLKY